MKRTLTILILFLICLPLLSIFKYTPYSEEKKLTKAERMYESILCYADSFNIPVYFAFNIATIETGYKGPKQIDYNPSQVSRAGALGPMQIMLKYSHFYAGRKVTKQELRDSLEFNVKLSMMILSSHYEKYGDWGKVAGAYNTGKPVINSYAKKAVNPQFYLTKWITP